MSGSSVVQAACIFKFSFILDFTSSITKRRLGRADQIEKGKTFVIVTLRQYVSRYRNVTQIKRALVLFNGELKKIPNLFLLLR